jgi:hypothetical protein
MVSKNRMGKEMSVAQFQAQSRNLPKRTEKIRNTCIRIVDAPTWIRKGHLSPTNGGLISAVVSLCGNTANHPLYTVISMALAHIYVWSVMKRKVTTMYLVTLMQISSDVWKITSSPQFKYSFLSRFFLNRRLFLKNQTPQK